MPLEIMRFSNDEQTNDNSPMTASFNNIMSCDDKVQIKVKHGGKLPPHRIEPKNLLVSSH